jgi:hypothetical protein
MEETTQAAQPQPPAENPFWTALRQPRIVLILLGASNIVAAVAEFFTDADVTSAFGGFYFAWEGIPLAVLYFYCARDPRRYYRVFWLAMVQQAAAIGANVYHWGSGDLSLGSIVIPIGVAGGLALLVFLHLFEPREPEGVTAPPSPGAV